MRMLFVLVSSLLICGTANCWLTQPPDGPPPGAGRAPQGDRHGPPRFELGKVLPPHLREQLELTEEQSRQIAELEKEVKAKLDRILTAEQKQQLQRQRPPMGPPGEGGPGGPPPEGGDRGRPGRPEGKPQRDKPKPEQDKTGEPAATGGIQWFGTLERGLAEAKQSGKPILLLSAAPHCGGIPGMW